MGRKSTIHKLDPSVRSHIEQLLRDDRLTLDEMLENIRAKFPQTDAPSRSSLYRYRAGFEEMTQSLREIETASRVLVDELGDGIGDKAGALLAQAVTTLATRAAFNAHERDDISIKEVGELSRAARAAMQARTMSLKERQEIEKVTRDKLLREQESNLQKEAKAQGLDENAVQFWREKILGIK